MVFVGGPGQRVRELPHSLLHLAQIPLYARRSASGVFVVAGNYPESRDSERT